MQTLTSTKTSFGTGYSLNGQPVAFLRDGATTRSDVAPMMAALYDGGSGKLVTWAYTPAQAAKLAKAGIDVTTEAATVVATRAAVEQMIARALNAHI